MRFWIENNPDVCLAVLLAITAAAFLIDARRRHQRRRMLRRLASQWKMNFSAGDRLRIAQRIADKLPIAGASDAYVSDVIYGSRGEEYLYVFTAEYTVGVLRAKKRELRVGSFQEPRERSSPQKLAIRFAPEELSIMEQYRALAPEAT